MVPDGIPLLLKNMEALPVILTLIFGVIGLAIVVAWVVLPFMLISRMDKMLDRLEAIEKREFNLILPPQ